MPKSWAASVCFQAVHFHDRVDLENMLSLVETSLLIAAHQRPKPLLAAD
jgi:hypothetical protein